jgi:hypothetical protein
MLGRLPAGAGGSATAAICMAMTAFMGAPYF